MFSYLLQVNQILRSEVQKLTLNTLQGVPMCKGFKILRRIFLQQRETAECQQKNQSTI